MRPIKQNDTVLLEDIQKIGCFFRAACHMAEVTGRKLLTAVQINQLWKHCKMNGFIDVNNNVQSSASIANAALKVLGSPGRFIEVAVFKDGVLGWYKGIPEGLRRTDYFIQKIAQNGPNKTHFVNVNKYGMLTWDPHEPEIKKIRTYYTICYRFDKEKK